MDELKIDVLRQRVHLLARKMAGEKALQCVAHFGGANFTMSFRVCERRCKTCASYVRFLKAFGASPVEVKRIRGVTKAAAPATAKGLPDASSEGPP